MKVALEPGKYVIAVSGGVDSVSLLHALKELTGVEILVAHFDHGIRADSREDRLLVEGLARSYGLPFVSDVGKLGPGTSEAVARQARYAFLYKARDDYKARAIVTAHHQDDVIETAIINLLRGTGRKGLSSLGSRSGLERPLLGATKSEILSYARQHGLGWSEDSTNTDETYLRNYIRRQIVPRLDPPARQRLLHIIETTGEANREIDALLSDQLRFRSNPDGLNRQWFTTLPHDVALEFMATWIREHGVADFDNKTLERLVVAAKTARPGSRFDILHGTWMRADKEHLALMRIER